MYEYSRLSPHLQNLNEEAFSWLGQILCLVKNSGKMCSRENSKELTEVFDRNNKDLREKRGQGEEKEVGEERERQREREREEGKEGERSCGDLREIVLGVCDVSEEIIWGRNKSYTSATHARECVENQGIH
jgi:hypothetical protein